MPLPNGLVYPKKWPVIYVDSNGKKRRAIIRDIHIQDQHPYYTISLVRELDIEKQTINERLESYIDDYKYDDIQKIFARWNL